MRLCAEHGDRLTLTLILTHRQLKLGDTLKQFAGPLTEQIDLSREAQHLAHFNANFHGNPHVAFPKPLQPLVSPAVLVESFESGDHISQYIAHPEDSPHSTRLAQLGSSAMLKMMLEDNLIHADLHPGNIMVRLQPPPGIKSLAYELADRLLCLPTLGTAAGGAAIAAGEGHSDSWQATAAGSSGCESCSLSHATHSPCSSSGSNAQLGASQTASSSLCLELHTNDDAGVADDASSLAITPSQHAPACCDALLSQAGDHEQTLLQRLQQRSRAALQQLQTSLREPQLVLLDVGVATRLGAQDQRNMVGLFSAFAALDGRQTAEWVLKFAGQVRCSTACMCWLLPRVALSLSC